MHPTFGFLFMLACVTFYYKAGEMEGSSGFLWGGLSLLFFAVAALRLHFGMIGCLLMQAGLFVVMTVWNLARSRPGK